MNCYYHAEETATTQCKRCEKHLCNNCHDSEYPGYCYSCSLDFRNGTKIHDKDQHQADERNRKTLETVSKMIGWYEIVGGSLGIIVIARIALRTAVFQQLVTASIFSVFAVLYLLSILAGMMLLRRIKGAERISMAVQLIQIPQFIIHGIGYSFIAGAKFVFLFYTGFGTGARINVGVFSEFNFYIHSGMSGFLAAINFVPAMLIYILVQMMRNKQGKLVPHGVEKISG
jgi:hypothetical protein